MAKHRGWSRDELLMAMNLYCRLPFGKLHKGTPEVTELARAIRRTPSSVAMKLCNLASLDPTQQARGIVGLSGASRADRAIWNEFHSNWEEAAVESQSLIEVRIPVTRLPTDTEIAERSLGPTEKVRQARIRITQGFFRTAVLASYAGKCCVSGITISELLIASHIVPWNRFPDHRVDPRNGLCLSRLHDAAFDRGLITFDAELCLVTSRRLRDQTTNATLAAGFLQYEGQPIRLPDKFQPNLEFLKIHREFVFQP